ncbi:MAG: enoyl-CoA hydratase/isomerase family protein [Planctomycetes bacterium]|nr:enoyl-CoA hydratase/isomerase family protein [Planctomycetota bacterium]
MIEVSDDGAVRTLRMAHGKANALDVELCEALTNALREAEASSARAIVLTGTGSIFGAGVDLVRLSSSREYVARFLPALDEVLWTLYFAKKPVVAAANGHAIAGGMVLLCACDHRILARGKAQVGIAELRVGVPFPILALEIVRRAVAPERFQEAVYRARNYSADEALARGFVDELCEPAELAARAKSVADELAAIPARTFALTKERLRAPAREFLEARMRASQAETIAAWCEPETLAAVRAFVERTLKR